jgi:hypothetical protein
MFIKCQVFINYLIDMSTTVVLNVIQINLIHILIQYSCNNHFNIIPNLCLSFSIFYSSQFFKLQYIILRLVVCILLRVLGQVQGFRLTQMVIRPKHVSVTE